MKITLNEWAKYRDLLSKLNKKAADEFRDYFFKTYGENAALGLNGIDRDEVVEVAYSISQKYGEAGAALAAEFYDEIAAASGKALPAAIPAEVAEYSEVAKTVNGAMKTSQQTQYVADTVGKIVKKASTDTIKQNAKRDKAEYAWIPNGDTCPYCLALASRGWQDASKDKSGDHLHAHCDCTYAVRFTKNGGVAGYDPERYKEIYDDADGRSSKDKINSMRREQYAKNKDYINAQKREAYARRKNQDLQMSDSEILKLSELRKKHKTLENAMLFGTFDESTEFKRLLELERATTKSSDYDKLFNQQKYTEDYLISWRTKPNDIQRDAISTYTSSQYVEMNGFLRNGGYATPKTKEEIEKLHEYLVNQKTQDDLYLKRGCSIGEPQRILGEFKNGDLRSIIGNTITDKGFVSTTAYKEGGFGGNIVMYIKAPIGTRGAYISDISRADNEKEFLLDCNQNFIIKDAKKVKNEYGFEVVEVFCEVIT